MIEEELSERENEAKMQFIIAQFERIGFDIRAHSELLERFKRLHSSESEHFKDSVQMVEIVDAIWDELEKNLPFKLDKDQLTLATLLHDVGKSGPGGASPEEQQLIVTLFNPSHYSDIRASGERIENMTLIDVLRKSDISPGLQQKIVKYLRSLGIDFETEKMIDFWRRHADWTYDILSQNQGEEITQETVTAAASHHILEGKNPAHLRPENLSGEAKTIEVIESYEVLTLVDKFQAFVQRSGLSHKEAVAVLRKIIGQQQLPDQVKNDFFSILDVIERSGNKLQNILKPRS